MRGEKWGKGRKAKQENKRRDEEREHESCNKTGHGRLPESLHHFLRLSNHAHTRTRAHTHACTHTHTHTHGGIVGVRQFKQL